MAYDPRSRLIAAEADEKYSEKAAKQNVRTTSIRSIIIASIIVVLLIGFIIVIFA